VAEFEDNHRGFVNRFQHILHATPSLVPLIVLADVDLLVFGLLLGAKRFFSPFALTLILQQVQIVGFWRGAKPRHPDRRHRPVGRRHRGAVLGCHGAVHLSLRHAARDLRHLLGLACRHRRSARSTAGWWPREAAALHRDAGHVADRAAANFLYSANETIRSQDIEAEAPLLQFLGQASRSAEATVHLGVIFMICWSRAGLCAASHGLGPACLCGGRRPEAAELAGVNVKRTLMSVYMLAG
jgi:fructose transport system permease protein